MKFSGKVVNPVFAWRLILGLLLGYNLVQAALPSAVDDFAVTLPNTFKTIAALSSDCISSSTATAILRVTWPAH